MAMKFCMFMLIGGGGKNVQAKMLLAKAAVAISTKDKTRSSIHMNSVYVKIKESSYICWL